MDQKKSGQFILQLRKEKGLTQKQLADEIGVSDKAVSKWENGNGMPDTGLLVPLCNALDITVNELLSGEHLRQTEYSERAEGNIIALLEENRHHEKNTIIKTVIGYVLIVFCLILNAFPAMNAQWYMDLPSLVYLAVLCTASVLISGRRGKKNIVELLRKITIPFGALLSLLEFIGALSTISDIARFGQNLYPAMISMLYAVVAYIVLVIVDR